MPIRVTALTSSSASPLGTGDEWMRRTGVESRTTVIRTAITLAGISSVAWALSALTARSSLGQAEPGVKNVFYRLYGLHEQPLFLLSVAFMVGASIRLWRRPPSLEPLLRLRFPKRPIILGLSFLVVILSLVGHRAVMHSYPLSMDEYNSEFQAKLFATGHVSATVPEPWGNLAPAITPGFVTYHQPEHAWVSAYLPVYAAIRALALRVSMASLLNPLLAGLSVLLIGTIAQELWPRQLFAPVLAALLLAGSSQFLATSMTAYSMPAHLSLNLLWLALYLKAGMTRWRWPHVLLPWVGVLALGLHNPFPHALFAAPFLLRILRSRRIGLIAYFGSVYLLGSLLWLAWFRYSLPSSGQSHALGMFALPDLFHLLTQAMSLSLILSWQTPVMVLGLGIATVSARGLRPVERDILVGSLVTLGLYVFFRTSQGHGWGYRYIYGVLGNLALLGVAGLLVLIRYCGIRRAVGLIGASLILTVLVQWPLRAYQMERFVRPFAAASNFIADSRASAVVIPVASVWYGSDLIRNDPDLKPPVVVAESRWRPAAQRAYLARYVGHGVRYVSPKELAAIGLVIRSEDR